MPFSDTLLSFYCLVLSSFLVIRLGFSLKSYHADIQNFIFLVSSISHELSH